MTYVTPDRYHHGDLPNALRTAAADVIAEEGLGRFSLREVARRAGVSHTAPAHHFGDVRGLLTALAIEGFEHLRACTLEAVEAHDDPTERLIAMGQAYVALAVAHPGHCQVMFRTDVVDPDDDRLRTAGMQAHAVLRDAVEDVVRAEGHGVDVDVASDLCWAAMQGLVVLGPKLDLVDAFRGREPLPLEERARQLTILMLDGIRHASP